MDYRLADPKYTGFNPTTVQEAIMKFRRLQATGISAWQYPEAFITCSKDLGDTELDKFHEWLVAPQGEPGSECVDVSVFSTANEKIHNQLIEALPPSDIPEDDEKCDDSLPRSSSR